MEKNLYKNISIIVKQGMLNVLPDRIYLKWLYKKSSGKKLDLQNPKTFNEKIQWLKLYDRKERYTTLVDKYSVKEYVASIIGSDYIVPTLGIWDQFDDIDFTALPEQFVLKCTHDSGGGIIVKSKKKLNMEEAGKKLTRCLKRNYYYIGREWPYKNVKRRIIAEKYLVNENGAELLDYKFMCFGGKVKCSFVCSERRSKNGLKVTFYDLDWNIMPFERCYPRSDKAIKRPKNYRLMIELAEKLSVDIPFVRVDFYEINNRVYFGEFTFYPGGGLEQFNPVSWDRELGEWIDLGLVKKE